MLAVDGLPSKSAGVPFSFIYYRDVCAKKRDGVNSIRINMYLTNSLLNARTKHAYRNISLFEISDFASYVKKNI